MLRKLIIGSTVLACALGTAATAVATPVAHTTKSWTVSYYSRSDTSGLTAYSASGTRNAWVVGSAGARHGIVRHWDGTAWHTITAPSFPSFEHVDLTGVSTRSASDTWVVGSADHGDDRHFTAVEAHWFRGRWYTHTFGTQVLFNQISVFARDNVWLLGADYTNDRTRGVYRHWNGTRWSTGTLPLVPYSSSASPYWAGSSGAGTRSRLLHYSGGRWTVDSRLHVTLNKARGGYAVTDIVQRSATDVDAAIAFAGHDSETVPGIALYHWNGRVWSRSFTHTTGSPGSLSPDGRGGLWVLSEADQGNGRLLDVRGGRVVANIAAPTFTTGELEISDLALRPGTRTLWAIGNTFDERTSTSHAVVAGHRR